MINSEEVGSSRHVNARAKPKHEAVNGSHGAVDKNVAMAKAAAIATNIQQRLHTKGVSAMQLAAHIDVSRASLSKAFKNPHRLLPRIAEIADFLGCTAAQLGAAAADVKDIKGAPVERYREELWAHIFGRVNEKVEVVKTQADTEVRLIRSQDERYAARWYLLAPEKKAPRDGDLVFVRLRGGDQFIRRWMPTEDGPDQVALLMEGKRPRVVQLKDLEIVRLIIGVLNPNTVVM